MNKSIYFSLYQKIPDYFVRIFQSVDWTLSNGVTLKVSIIGKSHRVISRKGSDCLTEFITCFDHDLPENSLESKCLKPGFLGDVALSDSLTHVFTSSSENSEVPRPFTGLVLSSETNSFYTVHTYPEIGISIISSTNIELPSLSIVK